MTESEFFIGWADPMPTELASTTKRRALGLILAGIAVALILTSAQRQFSSAANFEFGEMTTLIGICELDPVPTLVVARPGSETVSRYLLTVFGKHGAEEITRPYEGRWVSLEGQLVHRGRETMVELADAEAIRALDDSERQETPESGSASVPLALSAPLDLGEFTLEGEIVDSKCFLGVMKPGNLKLHRACATRCISGGVPPLFLVRAAAGSDAAGTLQLLLTDEQGGSVNSRILDHIAEPLRIQGRVLRQGDRLILRADPAGYERLTP